MYICIYIVVDSNPCGVVDLEIRDLFGEWWSYGGEVIFGGIDFYVSRNNGLLKVDGLVHVSA